jgi:hypothetical protein
VPVCGTDLGGRVATDGDWGAAWRPTTQPAAAADWAAVAAVPFAAWLTGPAETLQDMEARLAGAEARVTAVGDGLAEEAAGGDGSERAANGCRAGD